MSFKLLDFNVLVSKRRIFIVVVKSEVCITARSVDLNLLPHSEPMVGECEANYSDLVKFN